MMMRKIILVLVFSIVIYSAFLIISDISVIYDKILNFKIEFLPIIFPLIIFGWLSLFVRWHILLKNSNIHIPLKSSFSTYFSGFALSIIPGEVGPLIKAQILKNKFNISRAKTSPIVISEFLYTAIGLVSLSLLGGVVFEVGIYIGSIFACLLIMIFFVINSKKLFIKFMKITSKIKFISNFTKSIEDSSDIIKKSTSGIIMVYCSLLSVLHWLLESMAVFLIIHAFGIDTIQIIEIIPMYSTSILLGLASFLPLGGIGVVEGSFSAFLNLHGVELSIAFPIVITIRLFTIWFGILIGLFALKKYGGLTST